MNTKIRTAIISLIAAGSFATATVAPVVSQAAETKTPVTCDGYKPGTIRTGTVTIDGGKISQIKEICGSDGKWYEVKSVESKESGLPPAAVVITLH